MQRDDSDQTHAPYPPASGGDDTRLTVTLPRVVPVGRHAKRHGLSNTGAGSALGRPGRPSPRSCRTSARGYGLLSAHDNFTELGHRGRMGSAGRLQVPAVRAFVDDFWHSPLCCQASKHRGLSGLTTTLGGHAKTSEEGRFGRARRRTSPRSRGDKSDSRRAKQPRCRSPSRSISGTESHDALQHRRLSISLSQLALHREAVLGAGWALFFFGVAVSGRLDANPPLLWPRGPSSGVGG